ncbi:MAG: exodeoxyribonuclease VII large subunit [Prevotella sp.]|nr:exodeoxyribonuclease VII large subunit [Prevotella sp.]
MTEHYSLHALNSLVREAIEDSLSQEYWVSAELSEVRESRGHCYMELIEKSGSANTPIARASAVCWSNTWQILHPYFERTTGEPLRPGMKVLLQVYPRFHEAYGFSWIVSDIDPSFTMGDMALRRMEIIRILKEEGVWELNKELTLPVFTQRIAVISSATAAGYGDFCRQLTDNEYGFAFTTRLFAATMQGESVEQSVISALNKINEQVDSFDCVVIIRGGGAVSDMSGFDSLLLAENVANFPLPVITGIGHDRDECILDMISHTRVKTPTAAAALLISRLKEVSDHIDLCRDIIVNHVESRMNTERQRLNTLAQRVPMLFSIVKTKQTAMLDMKMARISSAIERRITNENHHLSILSERAEALNPQKILRLGYSITTLDGKVVRDASTLPDNSIIETKLAKGKIISIVKKSHQS